MKCSKVRILHMFIYFLLFFATDVFTQDSTFKLLGNFDKGWERHWLARKFTTGKQTVYEVVEEDSNFVLMGRSDNSASGLWHMLSIHPGNRGTISWRWKIKKSLSDKTQERTKTGDDFAARLFVVFEPHLLSWKTKAICYVWSANQPVGTQFKNPYSNSVCTVVLQSGNKNKGKWITEERDFLADYKKRFGKSPEMITAVALMVDTDNSGQIAVAWFDDISMTVSEPETDSNSTEKPLGKPNF